MRLAMPDGACLGIDVQTERGKTSYNGRIVDVDSPRHIRMLKAEGAFPADLGGVTRAAGYWCPACSRTSYFVRCGRCGQDNPREVRADASPAT